MFIRRILGVEERGDGCQKGKLSFVEFELRIPGFIGYVGENPSTTPEVMGVVDCSWLKGLTGNLRFEKERGSEKNKVTHLIPFIQKA
ncbi:hypothetical protein CDAR_388901 [Caerostris darwini]|uniref:Uncharacterized protein n=1 Tax=Caerostris darwini TaxID=1538125 RepID=A0AAV4S8D0_9ARAC|nr:hypothetical protein CDAR_388901 [Caerostris darwini]